MFLTAGFAAVAAALVIYAAVLIQFEKALFEKASSNLESQMLFAKVVAKDYLQEGKLPSDTSWSSDIVRASTRFSIIDLQGVVVFDSSQPISELDNHSTRPEILQALNNGWGQAQRYSQSVQADLLYVALRLDTEAGPIGYVRLSSAIRLISEDLRALESQLIIVILVTISIVLLVSYFLSLRFYQPISAATIYAREIAEGNYQLRLPGRSQDEVGVLERSLNELARKTEDRLDRIVKSRNQLEAILSGLDEGVVALDKDETIAHINRAALGLLGLSGDVVGKKIWEAVRIPKVQSMLEGALNDSVDPDRTLEVNNHSLEVSILTMSSDTGSHEGVILVFQDMTERDRLDKIRSDFVANASHELKTPLAAIKGIIETIIDDEEMPKDIARKFFFRVLSQTNRLSKIVVDLMQLSKFDSYRDQRINRDRVELVSELQEVYSAFYVTAEVKQVHLVLENSEDRMFVMGDSEALSQLISNLVENAIKYSPPDSTVVMRIEREKSFVVIRVKDDGIGISPAEQQRIFERFYRIDPARSRELGGTGLGLSIVKHIADVHEGSVEVTSQEGKGSMFTVRLPAAI
ncbi:MAG: two-component system phosphate regulon sensor histidine kinase PhoR [Candidatus Azotimanducaceae bacterium]|jgi:two-component system phosphate regulon sensor histidine kinase PhoR